MTNVVPIRPEVNDEDEPEVGKWLPVILGGMSIGRCYRCARTVTAETNHVEVDVEGKGRGVVCRFCAASDPDLMIWGEYCDVTDAIDRLMQDADGRGQRLLLAAMLASCADHFARWRWDEPEEADHA